MWDDDELGTKDFNRPLQPGATGQQNYQSTFGNASGGAMPPIGGGDLGGAMGMESPTKALDYAAQGPLDNPFGDPGSMRMLDRNAPPTSSSFNDSTLPQFGESPFSDTFGADPNDPSGGRGFVPPDVVRQRQQPPGTAPKAGAGASSPGAATTNTNRYADTMTEMKSAPPEQQAMLRDRLARDVFQTLKTAGHDVKWQGEQLMVDGRPYVVGGDNKSLPASGSTPPGVGDNMSMSFQGSQGPQNPGDIQAPGGSTQGSQQTPPSEPSPPPVIQRQQWTRQNVAETMKRYPPTREGVDQAIRENPWLGQQVGTNGGKIKDIYGSGEIWDVVGDLASGQGKHQVLTGHTARQQAGAGQPPGGRPVQSVSAGGAAATSINSPDRYSFDGGVPAQQTNAVGAPAAAAAAPLAAAPNFTRDQLAQFTAQGVNFDAIQENGVVPVPGQPGKFFNHSGNGWVAGPAKGATAAGNGQTPPTPAFANPAPGVLVISKDGQSWVPPDHAMAWKSAAGGTSDGTSAGAPVGEMAPAAGTTYTPGEITDDDIPDYSYEDLAGAGDAGPTDQATEDLMLKLLENPESMDPRTVEMMKARSKDELGEMQLLDDANLMSQGGELGIEDSPWLQSERQSGRRERDIALVKSNRDIEVGAATTNAADKRSALAAGTAYTSAKGGRNLAGAQLAADTTLRQASLRGDRMAMRESFKQKAAELGQSEQKIQLDYTMAIIEDATRRYGIDIGASLDRAKLAQAGREFQEELAFRIAQLSQQDAQFGASYGLEAGRLGFDMDNEAYRRYEATFGPKPTSA